MRAERAAAYAGPAVGSTVGSPASAAVIVSWAPHGTCLPGVPCAGRGVRAGVAGREAERSRGRGRPGRGCWRRRRPSGVEAGDRDGGPGPQPLDGRAGADPAGPGRGAGLGAQPFHGVSTSAAGAEARPSTAGLPSSVHSVASSFVSAMMASGTRPPHMPEWTACVSVRTSTSTRIRPRRLVVSEGTPMSQFPDRRYDDVAPAGRTGAAGREGRGGDLLLALDEEPHGDRQVIAQGAERAHVHRDPRLVVGRAPAEEALAADGGLERRANPVGRVVLRLDIVVRVKQDDRSARGSLPLADHGRRGAVSGPDDLGPDALSRQELGRLPRGLSPPGARVGADRLDPDESLKVADQAGQEIVDRFFRSLTEATLTIEPRPAKMAADPQSRTCSHAK